MRGSLMSRGKNTSPYYWLNNYSQEVGYLALVLRQNFRGVAYNLAVTARSLFGAEVPDEKVLSEYKRIRRELMESNRHGIPTKVSLNIT